MPDYSFLKHIQAVIWDIDGVKYNLQAYPDLDFFNLCDQSVLKAAKALLPHMADDTILQLAQDSYRTYHDCYGAFMPYASQSGLADDVFRARLFQGYHAILFTALQADYPDFFDHAKDVVHLFATAQKHIRHGALTHSSIEHWGVKVLDAIGVLPYFDPAALLGMDQFDYVRKADSVEPLTQILTVLDVSAHHSCFVEDSLRNLERARDVDGLHGIYIHYGKPLEHLPAYIDAQFENPAAFMTALIQQKGLAG